MVDRIEVNFSLPETMVSPAFNAGETALQERWETTALWDEARRKRLLWDRIPPELHARIESAPFFFLATSSADGRCDCSFKGGGPQLVRVLDEKTFAFPDFDGNGAFMSLGNIVQNPNVGCLFIDFNDGSRLRINGRAELFEHGPLLELFAAAYPDCKRVVRVSVEQVVPNCPKHIPKLVPAINPLN